MKTKSIILKKQNTNEYDQLVTCYTEEFGKVVAIAKSILKPSSIQAMHLDLFNLVEFELVGGSASWRMPIITGAQAEETYPNLKNNLPNLATAYFFTETIDKLAFEYQKDEELWGFISSLLVELDYKGYLCKGVPCNFLKNKQLEFLNVLGYAPNLKECVFCSKSELIAYNTQARGIVCKDCFLNGREGIVVKPASPAGGNNDFLSESVLGSVFESLAEKKLYSLQLLNYVLK